MSGRVLIVDDERSVGELLESGLKKRGFQVKSCTSGDAALALLAEEEFDAVVTDLRMKGMDGLSLCERIVANRPDVPVLVITAFGSLESAIAAIRAGAYDFLTKPFELEVLRLALVRAIRHRALREEVKRLRQAAAASQGYGEMLGASAPMRKVYDLIDRVAEVDTSVLVTGESGTGKELVARALHRRSPRRDGPFIAVNCAAVPEPLLESELFGHAKGAFTDAKGARQGLFFQASGGTLFLDEIGDMPLGLQPKLLRALQERRARPLGATEERPFDIRVVAATNSDIEAAVEERRFREDLYYRINVVHVELPPLRSRGSDVLLMAQHFVERFAASTGHRVTGLSAPAAEKLLSYSWPGNVRELSNCIERAVALARYEQIAVEDLPQKIQRYQIRDLVPVTEDPAELLPMDEVERRYIARVLEAVQGNKTIAAKVLGFDRATLYRKLARYGDPTAG
ncbi:sigma-54-dependent transcriptional regulator [Chondromyces crocatus]|uniref:Fis family transcriptional regulator n=1 Tax=Chondromyces crocatus TaxID=52 RepID=A0A0K1EAT2_CHOCO|nr:sigma-54 dependent transcriptional regulator [Chondromyces crocatus]AKT37964.1 Fis family transcriptional regulator [Chondromyces crocatus]